MSAALSFSEACLQHPPKYLVIGDSVYARTLASIIDGAQLVTEEVLRDGITLSENFKGRPRLLNSVERTILLWEDGGPMAELLWRHHQCWKLIDEWTELRKEHPIGWVIGSSEQISPEIESDLANRLSLDSLDASRGYALWYRISGIQALLQSLDQVTPTNGTEFEARKAKDIGWQVFLRLRTSLLGGSPDEVQVSVRAVQDHFDKTVGRADARLNLLDDYCHHPCHPNAHAWRVWLSEAVTHGVTPDVLKRGIALVLTLSL